MENTSKIGYITFLLSAVAGYCDTVTFVAADSIFSAHVTGNFIVFAYQLIKGSEPGAWLKLLTFPVFILSVIVGRRIGADTNNRYKLLLTEGIILLVSGGLAAVINAFNVQSWAVYPIAFAVVLAMGLQNAFGKLYAKETYGPTTMMTGNVTQASLDLGGIWSALGNAASAESLKKQGVTIGGFLMGCLVGAVMAKFFGLIVLVAPGILLVGWYSEKLRLDND